MCEKCLLRPLSVSLPKNNFAWVGVYPKTQRSVELFKKEWIAVLLNRSVYIMEHDAEAAEGYWTLAFEYRHQVPIEHARFIAPDVLVVVEAETGRLVAHHLGERKRSLY